MKLSSIEQKRPGVVFAAVGVAAISVALTKPSQSEDAPGERFAATDAVVEKVSANISDFDPLVVIEHAKLAQKEGVTMPPSTVVIYRDPEVDSALMSLNPRVGLDLPQKILVFDEEGAVRVAYQEAGFLAARHGINDVDSLASYTEATNKGLRGLEAASMAPVTGEGLPRDYGIVELVSDFGHAETITRLKEAILKQGDTVWFGDIDFKAVAADDGIALPASALLLFGGPKPGGIAMAKFPKLGLDAFCQKLLVYEDEEKKVRVIFNDIAEMAELHYGTSAEPHQLLNKRLTGTFRGAIEKAKE